MKPPPPKLMREMEIAWLEKHLGDAIADLGYPVGCGIRPHPEQLKRAATTLFERYAKMIDAAANSQREQRE